MTTGECGWKPGSLIDHTGLTPAGPLMEGLKACATAATVPTPLSEGTTPHEPTQVFLARRGCT